MGWPFSSSQRPPSPPGPKAKANEKKKRVSFAPNHPTSWPPPRPPPILKNGTKQVRFTSDTKPGSRSRDRNSAGSSQTRWPSPPRTVPRPTMTNKSGMPGLSSVRRDFETRKSVPRHPPPPPKAARAEAKVPRPTTQRASRKPDAQVSIPVDGKSYRGPPKARHERKGYEWVNYQVTVKPTGRVW